VNRSIEGFTVLINRRVFEHQAEGGHDAIREMESQLKNVISVVPPGPLSMLRKVRIWMEWDRNPKGMGEYHWDDRFNVISSCFYRFMRDSRRR
jgi:hypothetical protein